MRAIIISSVLAAASLAASLSASAGSRDPALAGYFAAPLKIETASGEHKFVAYLAMTDRQRIHGLMFVRELPKHHGMLFVYRQPRIISMWMKNTELSLDMLFIRTDGTIASIETDTTPHSLESVSSTEPVVAVLELNAGVSKDLGIKAGDRVLYRAFQSH